MDPNNPLLIAWSWFCFFLLGFGGWNILNSLFLEAPLFVTVLPEGANLSTYLLIAQQIASGLVIVPTIFWTSGASPYYRHIIITTLALALVCCVVLIIWSTKTVGDFSLPFLLMAVVTSMIGYISSTYYLPFVSLYKIRYTNAYTLGLGCSLAFTALMSLAQDSGGTNPRFGYRGFFGIMLGSNVVAFIAACWIIFSKAAQTQLVTYQSEEPTTNTTELKPEDLCAHQQLVSQGIPIEQQQLQHNQKYPAPQQGYMRKFSYFRVGKMFWYAPLIQGILAFFGFGIVPSLLYFAAGSYHNSTTIYMWALTLLYLVDPFARALYGLNIRELSRLRHLTITTGCCIIVGGVICILAGIAPNGLPHRDSKYGGALPIVLAAVCGWFYASSFTGSYALMFNCGSECSEDDLYALEKEKKLSAEEEAAATAAQPKGSSLVENTADGGKGVEMQAIKDNEQQVATTNGNNKTPCAPDQCPMCIKDSLRRDELRQALYLISGMCLQVGSFIGTMLGAALTVFTTIIPPPVPPVL